MQLPNLPTDNVYKFQTLSGVFLVLFGLGLPAVLITSLQREITNLKAEVAVLLAESEAAAAILAIKSRRLDFMIDGMIENTDNAEEAGTPIDQTTLRRLRGESTATRKELFALSIDRRKTHGELASRAAELEVKNDAISNTFRDVRFIATVGAVLSISGLALSVVGFRRWQTRLQVHLDRIVQVQAEAIKDVADDVPPR